MFRKLGAVILVGAGLALSSLPAAAHPPAWGHGHHAQTYIYYPHHEIYYAPARALWFWLDAGLWHFGAALPAYYRPYTTGGVTIHLDVERPYERHVHVIERYRPVRDHHYYVRHAHRDGYRDGYRDGRRWDHDRDDDRDGRHWGHDRDDDRDDDDRDGRRWGHDQARGDDRDWRGGDRGRGDGHRGGGHDRGGDDSSNHRRGKGSGKSSGKGSGKG